MSHTCISVYQAESWIFSKVDETSEEKIKEFEESMTKFLVPYKSAEETGYLVGDSITLADLPWIMRCTIARMAG